MKVINCDTPTVPSPEPEHFTLAQIIASDKEGVYRLRGACHSPFRIIVVREAKNISTLFYHDGILQPLAYKSWEYERFVLTDEKVYMTVK